jgi:RNA-directed DNA polymerase
MRGGGEMMGPAFCRERDSALPSCDLGISISLLPPLPMTTAKLSEIRNVGDLARIAGMGLERVDAYVLSEDQKSYYQEIQIPKKSKKHGLIQHRIVYSAKHAWLADLHRTVGMLVNNSVDFGGHVQGFVSGRSIRTNAEAHLAAARLLHADIKNFFDEITVDHVESSLLTLGAASVVGRLLAKACTIDGRLRQGTRCSPMLANLVCRHLDEDFLMLARNSGAVYTRYADDVTFSGEKVPEPAAVIGILSKHGFVLKPDSCFLQFKGRSQFVTGLNIADEERPRLQRRLKRRLRLNAYYASRHTLQQHYENSKVATWTPWQLQGMWWFASGIEKEFIDKLKEKFPFKWEWDEVQD